MDRLLKEPLLHFLLLGGLLFAVHGWMNRDDSETSHPVRISASEVDWLKQTWTRQRQRPPDDTKLRGLVTDYLKEKLLAREAIALGLDQNDTVVRRRLAQKMNFLVEDTARLAEPDDTLLRQFHAEHQSRYQQPASISFTQLYFNSEASAYEALEVLANNLEADVGERSLLARDVYEADRLTVVKIFGLQFADRVFSLETGLWQGPVVSGYGHHLVRVNRMEAARSQPFDAVREKVLQDWYRNQQEIVNEMFYQSLLKKYEIIVDDSIKPLIGPLSRVGQ